MTTFGAEAGRPVRLSSALKRRVVRRAIDFLTERERLTAKQRACLEAVPVRWRRRRGPSRFYLGPAHGHATPHVLVSVGRGAQVRWHTYRRVRAGLATPREGVLMPVELYATLALVHEFTHALQHGICGTPKRRYSEVETTEAEIAFVRRVAPEMHAQLVPVSGRRKALGKGGPSRGRRASTATRRPKAARSESGGVFTRLWDAIVRPLVRGHMRAGASMPSSDRPSASTR